MGLTIAYTIRLASAAAVPALFAAARANAKSLHWKVPPAKRGSRSLEVLPHPRCDPVRLDFSTSLRCEEFVKTSFAPLKTHVQVVEFLRALQPFAKSLKVEDECEFWETGDTTLLQKHRDGFDRAFGTKPPKAARKTGSARKRDGMHQVTDAPPGFIVASMIVTPSAKGPVIQMKRGWVLPSAARKQGRKGSP